MAVDLNLETISSGYNTSKINSNFQAIDVALQDAVSRSGQAPNQMDADFDMNGNDILNVDNIDVNVLTVDGVPIVPGNSETNPDALIPVGGTDGQVLTKTAAADYAVAWEDVPEGLPAGGTTGQVLAKNSDTDYDVEWINGVAAAEDVTFTPAGTIAATDVQAAIVELDNEKVAKTGDTMTGALNVQLSTAFAIPITATSTEAGATAGPFIRAARQSPSPAANDEIGSLLLQGLNSIGGNVNYAQITGQIIDPTSGSEDARIRFATTINGAAGFRAAIGAGVTVGNPTSGDLGAGTLNAEALYVQGGVLPPSVATRTALKALDTTKFTVAILAEGKRAGTFLWMTGDYSAQVTLDTLEGVYVKATAIASTSGAWVRVYAGGLNVLWFGADPDYVSDSAPAIKCARDLLETATDYRGGEIFIPKGRYKVNSTITFTYYAAGSVHNIYVRGEGVLATTLDFSAETAGTDGIVFGPGAHFGISDLMITGAKRRGLSVDGGAGFCSNYSIARVRIQQSTTVNFYNNQSYLGTMEDIWLANSVTGLQMVGYHTSMHVRRVYASGHSGAGFSITGGVTYSTFVNCASDLNTWGYVVSNVNGVSFISCGTESNTADGWLLRTSNALASGVLGEAQDIHGMSMIGCFNYNNSTSGAGSFGNIGTIVTADSRPIELTIQDCTSWKGPTAGTWALILSGASGKITLRRTMNQLDGAVNVSGDVVEIADVSQSVLLADRTGSDSSTAQAVFGTSADALSLEINTTYEFEAEYFITRAAGTTSHTTGVLFGGTATFDAVGYLAQITNPTGNVLANVQQIWAAAATEVILTAANTSATENLLIKLKGRIRTNAAGTLIPQFKYSAAPGGAPTIKANTSFRIWAIGSDQVTTMGPWA